MTQSVGSSNATYHYVSYLEPQQGLLDFPCATKSKIGTRLQQAGKLITFVLLVADVMISKLSGAHQMFPGSMPTVTLTVKCSGVCVIYA
jgi:hypothetical protein